LIVRASSCAVAASIFFRQAATCIVAKQYVEG